MIGRIPNPVLKAAGSAAKTAIHLAAAGFTASNADKILNTAGNTALQKASEITSHAISPIRLYCQV